MSRIAFLLVLAACGGKAPTPAPHSEPSNRGTGFEAATVSASGVTAADESSPPVLVMIDANGRRSLAAVASWKTLGTGTFTAGPKLAGDEASYLAIIEGTALGKDPKTIVDGFHDRTDAEIRNTRRSEDDPPPPETEDEGSGTAMALDEGNLVARQQAIEQARQAGILGSATGAPGRRSVNPRNDDIQRQAGIVGEVTTKPMQNVRVVVVPHKSAKAALVVKAVTEFEAMIGVRSGGDIRPLRIQFQPDPGKVVIELPVWLEVRLETGGLTIEAAPSKATTLPWADAGKLKAALADARERHKLDPKTPVDVLVAPEIDAQQLVDVLIALDGAGVTLIGLGNTPTGPQLAFRGRDPAPKMQPRRNAVPSVAIGQPNAQGDLDKAIIRRYIKRNIQKITYCYERELLATPGIQGTVSVQFFIKPDGFVREATATGVNAAVSTCVADVIKGIEFPKPKGGGGVQVNYPFVFRPDGG